jgi:hypothetical protein
VFDIIDRIEDRIFGNEATVSPTGWSCNSCTASAGDDGFKNDFRPLPDLPDNDFRPLPD